MAGSLTNFHKMDSRSACIQGVLKVKVKVKSHVIRALSWILGMSYSVIDGLVFNFDNLFLLLFLLFLLSYFRKPKDFVNKQPIEIRLIHRRRISVNFGRPKICA